MGHHPIPKRENTTKHQLFVVPVVKSRAQHRFPALRFSVHSVLLLFRAGSVFRDLLLVASAHRVLLGAQQVSRCR